MRVFYKFELKCFLKNFIVWSLAVGLLGFFCIILYKSMGKDITDMAEKMASMGAFADALGLNRLSIATLPGFFAAEVGVVHGLGSAMFAATVGTVILSKEEDAHTAEFTFTLPYNRGQVVVSKVLAMLCLIVAFNLLCGIIYSAAFAVLGQGAGTFEFVKYMGLQVLMNIEVSAICFLISAIGHRNRSYAGIGVCLALYMVDMLARAISAINNIGVISPFCYANATDVFSGEGINYPSLWIGVGITIICGVLGARIYCKKDLR